MRPCLSLVDLVLPCLLLGPRDPPPISTFSWIPKMKYYRIASHAGHMHCPPFNPVGVEGQSHGSESDEAGLDV